MTIRTFTKFLSLLGSCIALVACQDALAACNETDGVALQILGSGGPIADDGRASTGYLVWVDGQSRVLIDAGGGTFLRFGEAGGRFEDLEFVGLSHLHTDHSADFPALVKSGNFSPRERSLAIAGPAGAGPFPGLTAFLHAMFSRDGGAYAYLGSFLDGADGKPMLVPREVEGNEPVVVFEGDDLRVRAMRVPHGIVPAVAFRVETGGEVFVFSTDQNGSNPAFPGFAKDATVLVMHMVVPEGAEGVARRLHAPPSVIGEIAARVAPETLVLSHFMARSLEDLDGNVERVAAHYKGDIVVAEDLACVR